MHVRHFDLPDRNDSLSSKAPLKLSHSDVPRPDVSRLEVPRSEMPRSEVSHSDVSRSSDCSLRRQSRAVWP